MPNLQHNPELERHLTLAALAHCPRDYYYTDQVRKGLLTDPKAGDSLLLGILVHEGLAALWQQWTIEAIWAPSLALDAIDGAAAASGAAKPLVDEARKAILDYAEQWAGVRDHWKPVSVAPLDVPPQPWTVLYEQFAAYPDLIVESGQMYPLLVVDHKTSMWKFEADKWEWHPELLTQCLAAQQLRPESPIFYTIDFLQRPGKRSNVWCFPATPIWEFTKAKQEAADYWISHLFNLRNYYEGDHLWPREWSQCQTPYGLCKWFGKCTGRE